MAAQCRSIPGTRSGPAYRKTGATREHLATRSINGSLDLDENGWRRRKLIGSKNFFVGIELTANPWSNSKSVCSWKVASVGQEHCSNRSAGRLPCLDRSNTVAPWLDFSRASPKSCTNVNSASSLAHTLTANPLSKSKCVCSWKVASVGQEHCSNRSAGRLPCLDRSNTVAPWLNFSRASPKSCTNVNSASSLAHTLTANPWSKSKCVCSWKVASVGQEHCSNRSAGHLPCLDRSNTVAPWLNFSRASPKSCTNVNSASSLARTHHMPC